jgi:hypothetical protein
VWFNHASTLADKSQTMTCSLERHAFFVSALFDVLADAIFASTARLHTSAALVKSKLIEKAKRLHLSGVEVTIRVCGLFWNRGVGGFHHAEVYPTLVCLGTNFLR